MRVCVTPLSARAPVAVQEQVGAFNAMCDELATDCLTEVPAEVKALVAELGK